MKHEIEIFKSGTLPALDLDRCVKLLDEGGAVNSVSARAELPLAPVVAVHRHDAIIVGVGAIKQERNWYAQTISERSGFELPADSYELGYVATAPTHVGRGISKSITAKLLAEFLARPLFATTASLYMKKTLRQAGFQQKGHMWRGKKEQLSLWLLI